MRPHELLDRVDHGARDRGGDGAVSADTSSPGRVRPLTITRHARQRWLQRIGQPDGDLDAAIQAAWMASIPVGLQRTSGTIRLHPPTEALLVVKRKGGRAVLVTVLDAVLASESGELNDDHLQRCPACERRVDPAASQVDCPWCAASLDGQTSEDDDNDA